MSLSQELKEIYSQAPEGKRYYDTIELSHSLFSKTFYLVHDTEPHDFQDHLGTTHTYEPFAFDITMPNTGDNDQSMKFVFDNVLQIGIKELELAALNIKENIQLKYVPYVDGSALPQAPAITLQLTNVTATPFTIAASASRVNLFQRFVPNKIYNHVFEGIK